MACGKTGPTILHDDSCEQGAFCAVLSGPCGGSGSRRLVDLTHGSVWFLRAFALLLRLCVLQLQSAVGACGMCPGSEGEFRSDPLAGHSLGQAPTSVRRDADKTICGPLPGLMFHSFVSLVPHLLGGHPQTHRKSLTGPLACHHHTCCYL